MTQFIRFIRDESGATAVHYGVFQAGLAVAIMIAINALGLPTDEFEDKVRRIVADLVRPPRPLGHAARQFC